MAKAKHKSFIFDLKENQSIFLLNQIFIFTSVSHHRILLSTNSNNKIKLIIVSNIMTKKIDLRISTIIFSYFILIH